MSDTISASRLSAVLEKANSIGLVEEAFSVDGCDLVLRNLTSDDSVDAIAACQGMHDLAYLLEYQKQHIVRSIVEINGVDLRGVKWVSGIPGGDMERHTYILQNVVSKWSKETIAVVFRKFTEVLEKAEQLARKGVEFLIPEETAEEHYRRLLLEAVPYQEDLPGTLVDSILKEHGLVRQTTLEELKKAMDQIELNPEELSVDEDSTMEEEASSFAEKIEESPSIVELNPQPVVPRPKPISSNDPHRTLQDVIKQRVSVKPPVVVNPDPSNTVKSSRAEKIADLEVGAMSELDIPVKNVEGQDIPFHVPSEKEVMELDRRQERLNPSQMVDILDRPPVSGINPRFKPLKV